MLIHVLNLHEPKIECCLDFRVIELQIPVIIQLQCTQYLDHHTVSVSWSCGAEHHAQSCLVNLTKWSVKHEDYYVTVYYSLRAFCPYRKTLSFNLIIIH